MRKLRDALQFVLGGDPGAGLLLYDECVRGDDVHLLPIGLHLAFLRRAGRDEAAAALCALAIERGGNVTVRGISVAAEPEASAREYEACFAAGIGNARMVFAYLAILARLGREAEIAAILDPDRLLRTIRLDLPAPDGGGELAPMVEQALLAHELEIEQDEFDQSIRHMRKLEHFDRLGAPAVQILAAAIRDQAERLRTAWATSDHPLAHLVPPRLQMKCWGLISRGKGFNVEHIHARGWVTGVYYPRDLPEDCPGGELRIGRPPPRAGREDGALDVTVRPEAGLLVLMPSYYLHWTTPLGRAGLRTSIAFDMRPPPGTPAPSSDA